MALQGWARTFSCIYALMSPSLHKRGQAGDGRENAMLKHVLEVADKNPQSVLDAIDKYCERTWLMNIGGEKGTILDNALKSANPRYVLELGAYCGYSATLIASHLQEGAKLISVEMNPDNCSIARQIVEHAGLSSKVDIVEGVLSNQLEELEKFLSREGGKAFDFVFLDHNKNWYLPDMLLLKEHGLITKGTVIFADNMRIPGAPNYRKYVEGHTDEFDTVEHKCRFEYVTWLPDSVMISTCK